MNEKDMIIMNIKEVKRIQIINKAVERRIRQRKAAEILDLSERHVRRLVKRLKEKGIKGLTHGLRGQESLRKIPEEQKEKIIDKYIETYKGFGPTLAHEKFVEREKTIISRESLRQILIEAGLWEISRKSKKHRQWRERKHNRGEMIQMDGSRHNWFEGRGSECVLMAYIDDADGKVYAEFHEYEGTIPAMQSFKGYIKKNGIPLSLYMDKHTTYKATHKETIEDQLEGKKVLSQFERALEEIAVKVIHANSAQAKGRIERLFKTFQDRVIKEMRLVGIRTIEEGNRFLKEYLPVFNKRFEVEPASKEDLHRKVESCKEINRALTIREARTVRNDYTIAHEKELIQLKTTLPLKGKKVTVVEKLNGRMRVEYENKAIKYKKIMTRPHKILEKIKPLIKLRIRRKYRPPNNHPWKMSYQKVANV